MFVEGVRGDESQSSVIIGYHSTRTSSHTPLTTPFLNLLLSPGIYDNNNCLVRTHHIKLVLRKFCARMCIQCTYIMLLCACRRSIMCMRLGMLYFLTHTCRPTCIYILSIVCGCGQSPLTVRMSVTLHVVQYNSLQLQNSNYVILAFDFWKSNAKIT